MCKKSRKTTDNISGIPQLYFTTVVSFKEQTIKRPKTEGARTFPRYVTYFGIGLCSGKTKNGKDLVIIVPKETRKIVINSNGEEVAGSASIVIPTKIALINSQLALNSYIDNKSLDKYNSILNFTLNSKLVDHAWTLMEGDYIVDGKCDLEFDMTEIKKEHKLFQIISVADNRKGNLQHFKVEVSE